MDEATLGRIHSPGCISAVKSNDRLSLNANNPKEDYDTLFKVGYGLTY